LAVVIGPDGHFVFFNSHVENGDKLDWNGERFRSVSDNLEMISGANNKSSFNQEDFISTLVRETSEERGVTISPDQISDRIGWSATCQQRDGEAVAFDISVHTMRLTQEQLDEISRSGSTITLISKEEVLKALDNNQSAFRPSVIKAIEMVLQN